MSAVSIALLVFFVIICVLIVGLVLIQNEEGGSLGGLFAGGSNSAFGSRSGNVLTKTTYIMITLFFLTSFTLAWLNKSSVDTGLEKAAQEQQSENAVEWWQDSSKEATQPDADQKKTEQTETPSKTEGQ